MNLDVQISWQAQRFAVAGAALGELRRADFVAVVRVGLCCRRRSIGLGQPCFLGPSSWSKLVRATLDLVCTRVFASPARCVGQRFVILKVQTSWQVQLTVNCSAL